MYTCVFKKKCNTFSLLDRREEWGKSGIEFCDFRLLETHIIHIARETFFYRTRFCWRNSVLKRIKSLISSFWGLAQRTATPLAINDNRVKNLLDQRLDMNDANCNPLQYYKGYDDVNDSEDSLNLSDVSGAESGEDESSDDSDYQFKGYDFAQMVRKKDSCTSNSTLIGLPETTNYSSYANYANKNTCDTSSKDVRQLDLNFKVMQIKGRRARSKLGMRHKSSSASSLSSSEGSFVLTQLTPDADLDPTKSNFVQIEDERNKTNRFKLLCDHKRQSKSLGSIFCHVPSIPFIQSASSFFWHENRTGKDKFVPIVKNNFAGSLPII